MAPSHMKQRISERGPQFGCGIEMFSPIAMMEAIQGRDCAPLMGVPSNAEAAAAVGASEPGQAAH